MSKKQLIPILDNGHGGMINGVYQVLRGGKQSPKWDKGILYEGVFNRWIVQKLKRRLDYVGFPYFTLVPEDQDISLRIRKDRANRIFKDHKNTYILSVHANAGRGTGCEIWTSPGQTTSDLISDHIMQEFCDFAIPTRTDYTDGDIDKEAAFSILMTNPPAVLFECAFMDHPNDYHLLWSEEFQNDVVDRLFKAITTLKL